MVANYSPPPRKGRAAKTRANRSLSEESEEDSVEMIDILEEEEFSETLLLDPTSPPRKLSMKSKVILKRVDVARSREIHNQVILVIIIILVKNNSINDDKYSKVRQ